MKRVVVKVGSGVLTKDGRLDENAIFMLVEDIVYAEKEKGVDIGIITSGAVSAGRSVIDIKKFKLDCEAIDYDREILEEQMLASIGQTKVMSCWEKNFLKHGIHCGQILTTRKDFASRQDYLSMRTVVINLLKIGVKPIFNEDDTKSPDELDFTDNDQQAYMVAAMIQADKLILLTDVDGVYSGNPKNPRSKLIHSIENPAKYLSGADSSSGGGKGGMYRKLIAADQATSLGIDVHIANGLTPGIISRILGSEKVGTHFPAKNQMKVRAVKSWMVSGAVSKGKIVVSTYLADILRDGRAASILFSGIETIEGDFLEKDVVEVFDDSDKRLGRGFVRFNSDDLHQQLEAYKKTPNKEKAKSKANSMTAIHYNDFIRC